MAVDPRVTDNSTRDDSPPQLSNSVTPSDGAPVTNSVTEPAPLVLTDVDDIMGGATMPVVDEQAVARAAEKTRDKRAIADQCAGLTDSRGNGFDPALHVVGSDGKPVLTKTGKLRRRAGGAATKAERGGQSQSQSRVNIGGNAAQAAATAGEIVTKRSFDPDEIDAAAREAAGTYWALMIMCFGKHGTPDEDKSEPAQQVQAFKTMYERLGVIRLPWWIQMGTALTMPVVARVRDEDVRKDLIENKTGLASGLVGWWKKRRAEKKAKAKVGDDERA